MDVISLGKASKTLREIRDLNDNVVAPLAESRFPTVDARLDWLEGQASKLKASNSIQLNLSQETFTDTEFVDGKVRLKKVGEDYGGIGNILPPMTSSESIVPYKVTASSYIVDKYGRGHYEPWKAFDGVSGTTVGEAWQTKYGDSPEIWIQVELEKPTHLTGYSISVPSDDRSPQDWNFEGSHDGVSWDVIHQQDNLYVSSWTNEKVKTYEFLTDTSYTYYRVFVRQRNDTYLAISEVKLIGQLTESYYSNNGTWESPIIDLGEGWSKTNLVDIQKQINTGVTDCVIDIAYSSDGVSFSEYTLLDSANPPQARFIQIKATLTSTPEAAEVTEYDFNQQDPAHTFTLNEFTEADGQLKLKNSYSVMDDTPTVLGNGFTYELPIDKTKFKRIEKMEVK